MNRNVGIHSSVSNWSFLLLCVIGVLQCTGADAADQSANAAPPTSTAAAGGARPPASQPRKSQPLNWGSLNPQPLPPSPPDPSRSFGQLSGADQRGIIINGGRPLGGALPGSRLTPSVSTPAGMQLAPTGPLGSSAQASQRPMTPPPASPISNRPGLGTAQTTMPSNTTLSSNAGRQALSGARGKPNGTVMVSSKKVKFAPRRANLLSQELTMRDAENVMAQSIRIHATNASPLVARPAGLTSRIATAGVWSPSGSSPHTARIKTVGQNALHVPPGIWFVNNKESGFLVTPGGYVTIQGKGFGEGAGEVHLFGRTTPQGIAFQVIDWHDDEIYALLPQGITGVPDQPARLELITRSGTAYSVDNAKFRATRAEMTLTTHLDQLVELHSTSDWTAGGVTSDGHVGREESGTSIDCKAPGTDYLYFKPPVGWDVSGLQASFGRTDSGDGDWRGEPGDRVYTPGYDLGDFTRTSIAVTQQHSIEVWEIPVKWGVWRSHSSQGSVVPGYVHLTVPDQCQSSYQIAVQLIGPAGVSPY